MNASAFLDSLLKLTNNPQTVIRKKVLICLIKMEKIFPHSVENFDEIMEQGLRDKEVSVMLGVLPYFYESSRKNPQKHKPQLYIFVNIFQQILQQKLSQEYEYERHPAPWSIIKILQIFGNLCRDDKPNSEKVYNSIKIYLKAFNFISTDMDIMLLYQTILTIAQIYPNEELINMAVEKLDVIHSNSFLKKNNTLLLVLEIVSKLANIDKKYIQNYQLLLLDCLDSEDETIKHNTIRILFKTISDQNLQLVSQSIQKFIMSTPDMAFKKWTINKLYQVIEQRAPDPTWFLKNSLLTLEHGAEFVGENIICSIIRNIQEILSFDEESRLVIIHDFLQIFQ